MCFLSSVFLENKYPKKSWCLVKDKIIQELLSEKSMTVEFFRWFPGGILNGKAANFVCYYFGNTSCYFLWSLSWIHLYVMRQAIWFNDNFLTNYVPIFYLFFKSCCTYSNNMWVSEFLRSSRQRISKKFTDPHVRIGPSLSSGLTSKGISRFLDSYPITKIKRISNKYP